MSERELSPAALREHQRVAQLRPTESDFKGKKGYERYHVVEVGGERIKVQGEAPDGSYQWKYDFKPNDHGKPTRELAEVAEMMQPFVRANNARVESLPADPALPDQAGRRRGRSRASRLGDGRVERGVGGRWCLTTPYPWTPVPEGGNPDGTWK